MTSKGNDMNCLGVTHAGQEINFTIPLSVRLMDLNEFWAHFAFIEVLSVNYLA